MVESIRRVTGKSIINNVLHCLTLTDSPFDMIEENMGMPNSFDLEDTRRDLIAMRTRLGADTPAGHRCSNIIAQLAALKTATDKEQRKAIKDGIKQQIMELANLSGGVQ